jgi:glutamate racemase
MNDRVLDRELPIAVFDSGVGGLTVLHEFLV